MLPKEYQELQWVEFSGTQWVDTLFTPNNNTSVEIKIRAFETGKWIFGIRNSVSPTNTYGLFLNGSMSLWYQYNIAGSAKGAVPELVNNNHIIYTNKERLYDNDILVDVRESGVDFVSPGPLILGALDQRTASGTSIIDNRRFSGRIYYCNIWDNNLLVRNLIPCYRINDNKVGFFDMVHSIFYTNGGTEVLIKGPEVLNKTDNIQTEIDWTQSMHQTFEYYEVDPNTWKDKQLLTTVKGCSITRDIGADTLGSASIDVDSLIGEAYVRPYLIATQGKIKEKIPLGMLLVQTPTSSFNGKVMEVSMDAYTPLLELKENPVPLGYALLKGENIMSNAYQILKTNGRAPVIETTDDKILETDFVANTSDSWLTYVIALINLAKYNIGLDELGQILFEPQRRLDELQPVFTFNDDNSSILYPELTIRHDLFGIPNIVEVTCSIGTEIYTAVVKNEDINSPTSIQNRGREIAYRDISPTFAGIPTKDMVDEYAQTLLKNLSSVEYEISYSHGYCPVRIGDCVRLNYIKAGIKDVKAKVIAQDIKCDIGCTVSETAIFTKSLWK